ncbi:MAG: hypothetical protein ACKVU1_04420 [bacterium]
MSETQGATAPPTISEVRFRFAPGRDGLLGYASVRLGDHLLNDISIVRAADGNIICVYPRRFSSSGHPHYIHQPVNREQADALEEAIVGRLRALIGDAATNNSRGATHD